MWRDFVSCLQAFCFPLLFLFFFTCLERCISLNTFEQRFISLWQLPSNQLWNGLEDKVKDKQGNASSECTSKVLFHNCQTSAPQIQVNNEDFKEQRRRYKCTKWQANGTRNLEVPLGQRRKGISIRFLSWKCRGRRLCNVSHDITGKWHSHRLWSTVDI